jgi:hypothetical protein
MVDITPETIAEMAEMQVYVSPQQAMINITNVLNAYQCNFEQQKILRSSLRVVSKIVRAHIAENPEPAQQAADEGGSKKKKSKKKSPGSKGKSNADSSSSEESEEG